MRTTKRLFLVVGFSLMLSLAILYLVRFYPINQNSNNENITIEIETESYIDSSPLNGLPIYDDVTVYENDVDSSVKHVYITALSTIDEKTGEMFTLQNINQLDRYYDDYNPEINIIFQEGDEKGPYSDIFTPQSTQGNAVMRARGYSARTKPQKSFKIILNNNTELFLNQSTLNMNKHFSDRLRMTNKLCFDLFETIPDFSSLRTQFVNIYVRDLSQEDNKNFKNYGLFTMIEQSNKSFLESHGFDKNGNLYKAQNFGFMSTPELLNESDSNYNKKTFETVLEIEEGKDHTKLLSMIKDVENINLNINDVIAEHFNRENYLTWMAINIIVGNSDVTASNYLLYSPKNSKTWYFLPWDYDKTLYYTEVARVDWGEYPESQYGLGLFWGIPIHHRFFKDPQNLEDLSKKIDELRQNYITTEKVTSLTEDYKEVIKKYALKLPDIQYLPMDVNEMFNQMDNIDTIIDANIERYYANLENPMPIYMDTPIHQKNGNYIFSWDVADDLQGDLITYELQIARDVDFNYIVFNSEELLGNTYMLEQELPPDKYYFRVIIRDEQGHTQFSLEDYVADNGSTYRGLLAFEVQ